MVLWINCLPCKPGVTGSIPGFTSLSDVILKAVAPSPYDLSCWWDVKHKHNNNPLIYSFEPLLFTFLESL